MNCYGSFTLDLNHSNCQWCSILILHIEKPQTSNRLIFHFLFRFCIYFSLICTSLISFQMPGAGKMPWLGVSTGFDCHTMGRIPTFIDAGKHSNSLAPPEPEATRWDFHVTQFCVPCFCTLQEHQTNMTLTSVSPASDWGFTTVVCEKIYLKA